MTLKEPKISTFATIILNRKLFGRFFLLNTANQLQCGAGGALRLSGGASYDPQLFHLNQISAKKPNVHLWEEVLERSNTSREQC